MDTSVRHVYRYYISDSPECVLWVLRTVYNG